MSTNTSTVPTTLPKISPQVEAVLYFVGLLSIYLASWSPPIVAPEAVRTAFTLLGSVVIVVKYELSMAPKPQVSTHQALYSTIALVLSIAGGQLSSIFGSEWYVGLAVAVIGAVLAAYQDLGGKVPVAAVPASTTAPTSTTTTTGA